MAKDDDVDYSVLRDPVYTSIRGMEGYVRCIQNGTGEVRYAKN